MRSQEQTAIRLLEAQETELVQKLARTRAALRALQQPQTQPPLLPKIRPDYLLEYLERHPEGVRVKDVPQILRDLGFISRAANDTTNWLYQLPPHKQYFQIADGMVTLRRDLVRTVQDCGTTWGVPDSAVQPSAPIPPK